MFGLIPFHAGSVGWTIFAASTAARWGFSKLRLWGGQHLFSRVRETTQQSQRIAVCYQSSSSSS